LKENTKFKKGKSGNPKGRPNGPRNKVTLAVEELLDGQAEALTQKAVDMALGGDTVALRLCLERICPPRKDRLISFEMPSIKVASDMVQAIGATLEAVSNRDITPSEGRELAAMIEIQRRAIETEELEARITKLETMKEENR
tara:strand:+ start:851 stop:1276 length:426 start_codon:yes stop_codon:yes gene_type:complete